MVSYDMASLVTHVSITNLLWNKYFTSHDRKSFIIGTCFPDIRFMGTLSREETHTPGMSFSTVLKQSSYEAGYTFHSIVDDLWMSRFQNIVHAGTFQHIGATFNCPQRLKAYAYKLAEDNITHQYVTDWEDVITILESILKQELSQLPDRNEIRKWHRLLQYRFRAPTNHNTIRDFCKVMKYNDEQRDEITCCFDEFVNSKQFHHSICKHYETYEKYIVRGS